MLDAFRNCINFHRENGEFRPSAHNNIRISQSIISERAQVSPLEQRFAEISLNSNRNLLDLNNFHVDRRNLNNNGDEQSENSEFKGDVALEKQKDKSENQDSFILVDQTSDILLFNNFNDRNMKRE